MGVGNDHRFVAAAVASGYACMWQEPGTYRSKIACAHMELILGRVGYAQPAMDLFITSAAGFMAMVLTG